MKITNAWIDDPTTRGEIFPARLFVQVDEAPDVTIAEENFAGGWTVGKYGPFVKYTCVDHHPDAGDFNVRFRNRFPPVVDIELCIGPDRFSDAYFITRYSLPLKRARQLVRKYDPEWRLLISDRTAEETGTLIWVPVHRMPTCKHWDGTHVCGRFPTRVVRVKDVDLALCETHIREHNEKHRLARTSHS